MSPMSWSGFSQEDRARQACQQHESCSLSLSCAPYLGSLVYHALSEIACYLDSSPTCLYILCITQSWWAETCCTRLLDLGGLGDNSGFTIWGTIHSKTPRTTLLTYFTYHYPVSSSDTGQVDSRSSPRLPPKQQADPDIAG